MRRPPTSIRPVALALLLVAAAGCVAAPDTPVTAAAASVFEEPARPTTAPFDAELVALHATSVDRVARQMTVRVRAVGCGRLGTASGVAVAPDVLVTNRHVVAGAETVELNHWDGAAARARVESVATADDLAIVRVEGRLPTVARVAPADAEAGDRVSVAGYPNGGVQTIERGEVIEYAPLAAVPDASRVMRLSTPIAPGNSGGPVLDVHGDVVGVVFGVETATGHGLAVPASALRALIDAPATAPAASCG